MAGDLRQEATEARLVLRQLLKDQISLEVTHQDGRRCISAPGRYDRGLFEGFLRPQRWRLADSTRVLAKGRLGLWTMGTMR